MHEPENVFWETAEFDQDAWDNGTIMRKNGNYISGFMQKDRKLSPLAALPYVKDRMKTITDDLTLNSWFVDCDAAGELYESMEDDCTARKERIQYIIDEYGMVVGSELGNWYLTDTLHFAQGMMKICVIMKTMNIILADTGPLRVLRFTLNRFLSRRNTSICTSIRVSDYNFMRPFIMAVSSFHPTGEATV